MSQTLLFEIGLEEMPARYVKDSSNQFKDRVVAFLKENRIPYEEAYSFATPRRLAVLVKGVAEEQTDVVEKAKGPAKKIAQDSEGNWSKAAQGFARGQGVQLEDLYFEKVKEIEYVYADKETKGGPTREVLQKLPQVIEAMNFPVSMHWADYTFKFIRPIHWITALYGEEVIPMSFLDIHSDRFSKGHRFLGQEAELFHADEYEEKLKEQYVIVDLEKRKAMILKQIQEIEEENVWVIPIDEALLEEVVSLVEYPTAFYGDFDETYLSLPAEVLITSMKGHQRYFEVRDQAGNLLPHFISVRNGNEEYIDNVRKGNRKVLTARLEDALFFYEEDKKLSIADSVEKLKKVSFHAKIGSIAQKMENVTQLARILADIIEFPIEKMEYLERASRIYKFDLVTNMVSEFPELQGIMGEKYALLQGEAPETAAAIREHYLPLSSEGELPQTAVGSVLAAADKLDSIISFFKQGMFPSGSNDPYALRRQMIGIIQMMEAEHWSFEWRKFLNVVLHNVYAVTEKAEAAQLTETILDFAKGRIQQKLQTYQIAHDIQEAVLLSTEDNLFVLLANAKTLQQHHFDEDYKEVIEALARVVNISYNVTPPYQVDSQLLATASEKNLYVQAQHLGVIWEKSKSEDRYAALRALKPYVTAYFDENMVMVEEQAVRENRLNTLGFLTEKILHLADVRKIVTK